MSDKHKMPEEVVCYYVPGRISHLHVAEELYEKKWLQGQYRLKSTVDAQRAEDSKTIRELAAALGKIKSREKGWHRVVWRIAWKALSDNAKQIAEAQEGEG